MLRYFFKPLQLAPHKLFGLLDLVRSQGMLFPKQHAHVHIDACQIPRDFLEAFDRRNCAATDCDSCCYCETISRHAVRIEPERRRTSLEKFHEVLNTLRSGRLWNVCDSSHE